MYSQQRKEGKLNQMSKLEIEAIQKFTATYIDDVYPIPVAEVLRKNCVIDDISFQDILQMQRRRLPQRQICEKLVNETINNCSLEQLIKTLYDNGFKSIAQNLFTCYRQCQNEMSVMRVRRADTSNRRKIGEYFKHIKQLVHAMAFNNAYSDVQKIGERMKLKILQTNDEYKRMVYCDQFVALKAAEMDALTNIAGRVSKDHPGYLEIDRYATSTSNPALSQVILYGRQSDVVSTTGDFDDAENLMKGALVMADTSGSCVEVTDMIYKNVVVKLSKFERNPHDEELRKSIVYEADKGLWTLQGEKDDLRIFWTKLFLLRMAFTHLGIGKFCHIVKNYIPTMESIVEAERILKLEVLQDLEHRRQMFMAVAKARLNEWKGKIDIAVEHLQRARVLANEGKYAEDEALKEYEQILTTNPWGTHMNENLLNRSPINISTDISIPELSVSPLSTSSFDAFTTASSSNLSTTDDETSTKELTSSEQNVGQVLAISTPLVSTDRNDTSDDSYEHLDPHSLQDNTSSGGYIASSLEVQQPESICDSFPSLEHLHLSSLDDPPLMNNAT